MDHFLKPKQHYKRDIDPIRDYVKDTARYLSIMSGDPIEQTTEYVKQSITEGKRKLQIPRTVVLHRGENGDRKLKQLPFNAYLSRAQQQDEIMAPTMTTYLPSYKKSSILGVYITGNLKKRSASKAKMFEAEMNKDAKSAELYDSEQSTFKIKNNALSGGQTSPSTPLWNKTGHSTLTSTCRTATSYANANNEKFLFGNRHYYSPAIVRTNIVSILNHTNLDAVKRVMDKWNIRPPTVDETMLVIERGSSHYWQNQSSIISIRTLVERLTDLERSAFVYIDDLYHLAQFNPGIVKRFINRMSERIETPITDLVEADEILSKVDSDMTAFISIICAQELKGKNIASAKDRWSDNPKDYGIVAATAQDKYNIIEEYLDIIETFWVTDNLPSSVYSIPSIVRKGVLTSDTDSTIFTVQYWVEWMLGKVDFSDKAIAITSTMVYIAGQLVKHILATMCGNMGVEDKHLFMLQMKNEYFFPTFVLTSRAKHYYGYMGAREGLVFDKHKTEIKGVALRSSAISADVVDISHETMFSIMDSIIAGNKISVHYLMRKVATMEREVLALVKKGEVDFFKKTRIQERSAYKDENGGNYQHYELWQSVFSSRYNDAPEPPYNAIKIPLTSTSKSRFNDWLESIEDPKIKHDLIQWSRSNKKNYIGTLLLPQVNLIVNGMPTEIMPAIDVRSLLSELMESMYLILEGLGIYVKNKKVTRLLSDDPTIESLPEGVLIRH